MGDSRAGHMGISKPLCNQLPKHGLRAGRNSEGPVFAMFSDTDLIAEERVAEEKPRALQCPSQALDVGFGDEGLAPSGIWGWRWRAREGLCNACRLPVAS